MPSPKKEREASCACCKRENTSIPIKDGSSKRTSFSILPEQRIHHDLKEKLWTLALYAPWPPSRCDCCFTFSGDAGGWVGGGGCVPARCGLFALGCRFGDDRGGEGVQIRGVDDVAHLVLSLKKGEMPSWKKHINI